MNNFNVGAGSFLNFGSGATTTVSGVISGGGSVNYHSPVTLNAANIYTGNTAISSTVTIGAVNALPTSGTVSLQGTTGQLAVNNDQTVAAAFYFNRTPTVEANSDCQWPLKNSADYDALGDIARDRAHFTA